MRYVSRPDTKVAWANGLTIMVLIISETISGDTHPNDAAAKERQQALYATVCEPIIRRAELLLRLVPASIASVPRMEEALKMLPGISIPINYGKHVHAFGLTVIFVQCSCSPNFNVNCRVAQASCH